MRYELEQRSIRIKGELLIHLRFTDDIAPIVESTSQPLTALKSTQCSKLSGNKVS